jgi:hypothetical protein
MATRTLLVAVAAVAVLTGVAVAAGFDGMAVTLADDTSIKIELNVPHGTLAADLPEGGAAAANLVDRPGLMVTYFDHKLLCLMPVKEVKEVELGDVGRGSIMAAILFYPKPRDFDGRWPLVNKDMTAGLYLLVAHQRGGKPSASFVSVKQPRKVIAANVRLPERGITPGAMLGQGEVHPFVTQIRNGCTFGVGLVLNERLIACDLIR